MKILDRIQFATLTHKGPDNAISKLLEASSYLIQKISDYDLAAIGISCGGPLDSKSGIIQSPPNLPGWDNIKIVSIFKDKYNVPVFLQDDGPEAYGKKGLSILIDILNPQRIVIGSVYARNPQLFEKACMEIIDREALKPARDVCEIVPAALGDQIGDPSEGKHPIIAVRLLLKVW